MFDFLEALSDNALAVIVNAEHSSFWVAVAMTGGLVAYRRKTERNVVFVFIALRPKDVVIKHTTLQCFLCLCEMRWM